MVVARRLIPGFEIVQRLASGGSAGVFHAYREDDGVEVALKVMSLAELDPEFHPEQRFRREAELLARLSHPVLPQLYDYGVTDEGYAWLALELVRGDPLSSFSDRSALELLPLFTSLAEGLLAVAQEGIVHRDVAPDNVLVSEMYGRLSPKVIDFGIAKDLFAGGAGAGLTQHGAFLGKFAYASPEQLVGLPKGETLDFRSDVYSLGMTIYELLAGRRAIEATSMGEIVDAHLAGRFPPLVIPPERGGPAGRLTALVGKMLARKREDRPGSWEEVIAELWLARAELAPLAQTLAVKRQEHRAAAARGAALPRPSGLPPDEVAPFPEASTPPPPLLDVFAPVPVTAARMITRELLLGRIALGFGIVAFVASLLFAAHVFLSAPKGSSRSQLEVGPAVTAAPVETGVLHVSLFPEGRLDAVVDASGRTVPGSYPVLLPTRLTLAPGRYRVDLSAPRSRCTRSVEVVVVAGTRTDVHESCSGDR